MLEVVAHGLETLLWIIVLRHDWPDWREMDELFVYFWYALHLRCLISGGLRALDNNIVFRHSCEVHF